eukprot:1000945-Heterocapsa_arctica.AAC.1
MGAAHPLDVWHRQRAEVAATALLLTSPRALAVRDANHAVDHEREEQLAFSGQPELRERVGDHVAAVDPVESAANALEGLDEEAGVDAAVLLV